MADLDYGVVYGDFQINNDLRVFGNLYYNGEDLNAKYLGINANADSATKWQTPRTISLTGDVTGTISNVDGTGDISISTTVGNDTHTHDTRYYTEGEMDTLLAGKEDSHTHPYDNYVSWSFAVDGTNQDSITSGDVLNFKSGSNVTITRSLDDEITISSSYTNTWRGIDDVPVDGVTDQSISSNWAYDHENASANPHGSFMKAGQLTFTTGELVKTFTHGLGTDAVAVTIGSNSPQRHIYWENKTATTVDIRIDDEPYNQDIDVDIIVMRV